MIRVYDAKATDFTGNGLGGLMPSVCRVTETLGGEYELEIEHPLDEFGKWQRLQLNNIVLADVPSMTAPGLLLSEVMSTERQRTKYTLDGWTTNYGYNPIGAWYGTHQVHTTAHGAKIEGVTITDVMLRIHSLKTNNPCTMFLTVGNGTPMSVNLPWGVGGEHVLHFGADAQVTLAESFQITLTGLNTAIKGNGAWSIADYDVELIIEHVNLNAKKYRFKTLVQTGVYNTAGGTMLDALRVGSECVGTNFTQTINGVTWVEVYTAGGAHGWARWKKADGSYNWLSRGSSIPKSEEGSLIQPKPLKEQPFRIYEITPKLDGITAKARHIFYDLLGVITRPRDISDNTIGANAVMELAQSTRSKHPFAFHSNLTTKKSGYSIKETNFIDALLGDDGIAKAYKGELLRDRFDVYLMKQIGQDSGLVISEGKNLRSMSFKTDASNVVTRIIPKGKRSDGSDLYLDGAGYVEAKNAADYPVPIYSVLEVSGAQEGQDMSLAQAQEKLRKEAEDAFEKGAALPDYTVDIDMVSLSETEEYKLIASAEALRIGDTVTLKTRRTGINAQLRMVEYTFDCILRRYEKVTLGTPEKALDAGLVSAAQIANGSIGGGKLAFGAVGSQQIGNASVTSAALQLLSVGTAHIKTAAVDALVAKSIQAAQAQIDRLTAGKVEAEQLEAKLLQAVTARIRSLYATKAEADTVAARIVNAVHADIGTADVETLKTKLLDAAKAEIAELDADHLTALEADVVTLKATNIDAERLEAKTAEIVLANIAKAVIKTAQIENLESVIRANISSATIGTAQIQELESVILANIRNAVIDYAKVRDIAADHALIRKGTAGEYFIDRLAVTAAQMVDLTVGKLCVKAADGKYYNLTVDISTGTVRAAEVTPGAEELSAGQTAAGRHIVETDLTVTDLNATSAKAVEALIGKLTAGRIDVDQLFAREATIAKLNAMDITGNEGIRLIAQKADGNEGQIAALSDQITATVTVLEGVENALDGKADAETLTRLSTQLRQTAESLTATITRTEELEGGADATAATLREYQLAVRIDAEGVSIGKSDSDLVTRITNNRMSFLQAGTEVAYISSNQLHIMQAHVEQSLRLGQLVCAVDASGSGVTWTIAE